MDVVEKLVIVSAAGSCIGVRLFAKVTCVPPLFEAGKKSLPITVMVTEALLQLVPQAAAEFGVMLISVGTGFGLPKAKNDFVFDRPLLPVPDCGVRTLIKARFGVATKLPGMVADSVMLFRKFVHITVFGGTHGLNFLPFHWIAELL